MSLRPLREPIRLSLDLNISYTFQVDITFSAHAAHRMEERAITEEEVKSALESPVKKDIQGDTEVAMWLRTNGHLLIIIYRKKETAAHVITVIDTSKLHKYL